MKRTIATFIFLVSAIAGKCQSGVYDFKGLIAVKNTTPTHYRDLVLLAGWVLQDQGYDAEIQSNYIKLSRGLNFKMELRYSKDTKYLNYTAPYNTHFQETVLEYLSSHGYANEGINQSAATNQRWTVYQYNDANFNDLTFVKIIENFDNSDNVTSYEYEIIW